MPKRSSEDKAKLEDSCKGGNSYNRRRTAHEKGRQVQCYRCHTVMGCEACCEPAGDLICLRCHNWATRAGVDRHGDVLPNEKIKSVFTDRGWRHLKEQTEKPADVLQMVKEQSKRVEMEP